MFQQDSAQISLRPSLRRVFLNRMVLSVFANHPMKLPDDSGVGIYSDLPRDIKTIYFLYTHEKICTNVSR